MQAAVVEKEGHIEEMGNKNKHMRGLLYRIVDGKYEQYLERCSIKLWKEFVQSIK